MGPKKFNYSEILILAFLSFISIIPAHSQDNMDELVTKESNSILNPNSIKEIKPQDPDTNPRDSIIDPTPKTEVNNIETRDKEQLNIDPAPVENKAVKLPQDSPKDIQKPNADSVHIDNKGITPAQNNSKKAPEPVLEKKEPNKNDNLPKSNDSISLKVNKNDSKDIGDKPEGNTDDTFNKKSYLLSDWLGSLLFSADELNNINQAISESFLDKKPSNLLNDDITNSNLALTLNIQLPDYSPTFYLNSILYKSPDDWVIWVNKKDIRSKSNNKIIEIDKDNSLEIVQIHEKYVILKWKNFYIDNFCPEWKNILIKKINSEYYSYNGDIYVNEESKYITFELRVNQTFAVNQMSIKEGYIAPSLLPKKGLDKTIESVSDNIKQN